MVHKFYAIKSEKDITKATVISTIFALIIGGGAYLIGVFGRVILNNTLPKEGFDKIIPDVLMKVLSGTPFAAVVFSIAILLVLSASMSTLAAVILTSSSAIAVDIVHTVKPDIERKREMLIMRGLCVVFIILSCLFATLKIGVILDVMAFSWGIVSGAFIGPYIWGLYYKKTTKAGAWSGMVAGFLTVVVLVIYTTITKDFNTAKGFSPQFGSIAMLVSTVVVPVVSWFTKKYDAEFVKGIFAVD